MQTIFGERIGSRQLYYPRRIPVLSPQGENVYEFLIVVKDEIGILAKIASIFFRHRINLLSHYGYLFDPSSKKFVQTVFCDFGEADCTSEQVASEIRRLAFVTEIKWLNVKGVYFDQFLFPTTSMNDRRVVFIQTASLLEIEKRLESRMGSGAAALMFDEGKSYATKVATDFVKSQLGEASEEEMFSILRDALRANGWGLFEIKRINESTFKVTAKETIGDICERSWRESSFARGVFVGAFEVYFGGPVTLSDPKYENGVLHFNLVRR